MLSVKSLSFRYPNREVLKQISFSLGEGELVFLLGANGAGKSTLFSCILGHLPGWTGEIELEGRSAAFMTPRELAKTMAYIPQSHHPTFSYSVEDMVLMGTTHTLPLFGAPGERERGVAREAMESIGISHLAPRDFQELSGGEQQMVLIARALAQQGKVLIMDEPTSNLDYGNQIRVLELVRRLAQQGYTVLLSCHDPQLALLYGDRVIALHGGEIVADGPPEQAVTPELLRTLYQVSTRFVPAPGGALITPVPKAMHQWQPDMIRFMEDAAGYTDFFGLIARTLAKLVPPDATVCDGGCGLGFTALELARHFAHVRAIDLSEEALEVLRRNNTFDNLEILRGDLFSMPPARPYDAMVFCRFGQPREIIKAAREQCRGTVLIVQKDARHHRFTTGTYRNNRADFGRTEEIFTQLGIPFRSERIAVDVGQPLASLEEGVTFFRIYDRSGDPSAITVEEVRRRVVEREDPRFPYYYPMETVFGFLSFHTQDLPPLNP